MVASLLFKAVAIKSAGLGFRNGYFGLLASGLLSGGLGVSDFWGTPLSFVFTVGISLNFAVTLAGHVDYPLVAFHKVRDPNMNDPEVIRNKFVI